MKSKTKTVDSPRAPHPRIYRERDGVSLLLGMGIIFIMVFFSLLVGNVVVSSIRQTSNVSRSNEAYYAAEGALEQGLLDNFNREAGYDSENQPVDYNNTNLTANYQIQGTVPENRMYGGQTTFAGKYGIPTPGTGNAGANCDPEKPFLDKNFNFTFSASTGITTYTVPESGGTYDPADHPCNWNKIKTGETVTIPLYYEDEYGMAHNLFGESSEEKLIVRLRTPCFYSTGFPPEMCSYSTSSTAGRFILQYNESYLPANDPILTWQVQGVDVQTGNIVMLEPYVKYNYLGIIFAPNHIVTETLINVSRGNTTFLSDPGRFIVFNQFTRGKDITGITGCMWHFLGGSQTISQLYCSLDQGGINPWGSRKIHKPVLKLSVIGNLINQSPVKPIPYLEYQIITSANLAGGAPVNTAQTITAEGVSGTFKQILQVNQPQAGGLPDYVVQQ